MCARFYADILLVYRERVGPRGLDFHAVFVGVVDDVCLHIAEAEALQTVCAVARFQAPLQIAGKGIGLPEPHDVLYK